MADIDWRARKEGMTRPAYIAASALTYGNERRPVRADRRIVAVAARAAFSVNVFSRRLAGVRAGRFYSNPSRSKSSCKSREPWTTRRISMRPESGW